MDRIRAFTLATLPLLAILPFLPASAVGEIPCADPRGCPDLWVDSERMAPFRETRTFSATSCAVVEGMVDAGTRNLLRFTFSTPNSGPGDLIVGAPSQHPEWFVYSGCHKHYHFREYADYRLWEPAGYAAWRALRLAQPDTPSSTLLALHPELAALVVTGEKAGFCVIDILRYEAGAPSKYHSCSSNQGISRGWADVYAASLDGQWVDITGVHPGAYVLEAEVNAERFYVETDYSDNSGYANVVIT